MSIANTYSNKAWHLVSRPSREQPAGPHNFRLVESSVAEPAEGQVLVKHLFLSLDPYMRGRMNDGKELCRAAKPRRDNGGWHGWRSRRVASSQIQGGDRVVGMGGWQLYSVERRHRVAQAAADDSIPIEAYIGPAGMPGITALGLERRRSSSRRRRRLMSFPPPRALLAPSRAIGQNGRRARRGDCGRR